MATDFERDRSVKADMERVFGPSALPAEPATDDRPAVPGTVVRTGKPGRRWLLLAAPVLAALFVIALAVRFALTLVPANVATPAPARAPASAYVAAAPRPVPTAIPVAEPATPEMTPDDFGPAPVDDRPAAAIVVPPVAPDTAAGRTAPPRRAAAAADCPPGSDEDRCIYQDVVSADRRLRAAYDAAVRAGVPTGELVAVRRRWDRARAISLDAPDETIRRYRQLTERLEDLTR